MIDELHLYYFSGTGNCRKIVDSLSEYSAQKNVPTKIFNISRITIDEFSFSSKVNGLVFPLYFGAPPSQLISFIKKASGISSKHFFIISGGALPLVSSRWSCAPLVKMITHKKGNLFAVYQIVMPLNILSGYPDSLSKQLCFEMERRTEKILCSVINIRPNNFKCNLLMYMYARSSTCIQALILKYGMAFYVDESCIRCGLCIRNCPSKAIKMDRGVVFNNKCLMCLKCINSCPVFAIKTRRLKFLYKKRYKLQLIVNDDTIRSDYLVADSRGVKKILYKYFEEFDC